MRLVVRAEARICRGGSMISPSVVSPHTGLGKALGRQVQAGLLAAVSLIAGLSVGSVRPGPKEIVAEGFVIKDAAGRMRGRLSVTPAEGCDLSFFDEKGARRLSISVDSNSDPRVRCMDCAIAGSGGSRVR